MALEDAWVLADCLAEDVDVTDALRRYAHVREPRTTAVQSESSHNRRRFHSGNPAYYALMRLAARARPQRFIARFDWIYGHDVTAGAL